MQTKPTQNAASAPLAPIHHRNPQRCSPQVDGDGENIEQHDFEQRDFERRRRAFEAMIRRDMEHESHVLYRILVAFGVVIAALLLREALLFCLTLY